MNPNSTAAAAEYAEHIFRDGYAIVPGVLAADQVEALRAALAAIPDTAAVRRRHSGAAAQAQRIPSAYGIRNLLEGCPAVRQLASSEPIRRLVTPILGDACFAVRTIYFDKTSDANWNLGWHQDGFINVQRRVDVPGFTAWSEKAGVVQVRPPAEVLAGMLAIRVHLDDCPATNGPLRMLPGSHRCGWLDGRIEAWKQSTAEVQCLVDAGGVVVMRPLLLHASSAASQPGHRRVLHIEYACQDLPGGLEWNWRERGGKE